MSEELIKKSDAIKAIKYTMLGALNTEERISLIMDIPTIEPKRGEWIPHKEDNGKTVLWKCSECGQIIYSETETDRLEFHKWCSRCGADMRGKDDEMQ